MKVVINKCYGGFGLSPKAIKRWAELNGRECYFFTCQRTPTYDFEKKIPVTLEEASEEGLGMWSAFDIPNPDEVIGKSFKDKDGTYKAYNELYGKHHLYRGDIKRDDPTLVRVVEELGSEQASGSCAELEVVEIPDGVSYKIEEYDGKEWVAERHRTWG